jgi:NAD(P)H-hydrate epimerase
VERNSGALTPGVPVTTAAQAAARDAAAIAAGTPSSALMTMAGRRATDALKRHAGDRLRDGVAIYAGPGNNGGDAWVVAGLLRRDGVRVRVHIAGEPSTPDAKQAQATACASGHFQPPRGDEAVVVDGVLGTGSGGAPRGAVADALSLISAHEARGAYVAALDVPTGLDANTGAVHAGAVRADLTVSFGTMKRGLLVSRHLTGLIEVVDIGLGEHAHLQDGAPLLLDAEAVRASIPPIAADAHKGSRGRITIVGGARGMAGAPALAARGALRAGAGLVRLCVSPDSIAPVQSTVPEATAAPWPQTPVAVDAALGGADAVIIGPGLGPSMRDLVLMIMAAGPARITLDADALNAFSGAVSALRDAARSRAVVITPHAGECARLLGVTVEEVLRTRFDIAPRLAQESGAVVVLKGTPTIVSAADGRSVVAPVGSPVLATGGSGDVLAGLIGALSVAFDDPFAAALAGVWAHGAAAERVTRQQVRGSLLSDVIDALRDVWHAAPPPPPPGVLASLPAVGG